MRRAMEDMRKSRENRLSLSPAIQLFYRPCLGLSPVCFLYSL